MNEQTELPNRPPQYSDLERLIATNALVRSFAVMERAGLFTREEALVGCVLALATQVETYQKQELERLQHAPSRVFDAGPL